MESRECWKRRSGFRPALAFDVDSGFRIPRPRNDAEAVFQEFAVPDAAQRRSVIQLSSSTWISVSAFRGPGTTPKQYSKSSSFRTPRSGDPESSSRFRRGFRFPHSAASE
jgi:hypothetical protein